MNIKITCIRVLGGRIRTGNKNNNGGILTWHCIYAFLLCFQPCIYTVEMTGCGQILQCCYVCCSIVTSYCQCLSQQTLVRHGIASPSLTWWFGTWGFHFCVTAIGTAAHTHSCLRKVWSWWVYGRVLQKQSCCLFVCTCKHTVIWRFTLFINLHQHLVEALCYKQ